MAHDLLLLVPEIAVLLTAVVVLVCEMLRRPRAALSVTVAGLALAALSAIPLLGVEATAFSGTFRVDALSTWACLILLPATALSALLARAELAGEEGEGTVYSLLCFTALGALILAGSGDLMLLVLGVLLSSLGSFALVAHRDDDRATEAAMKYFVFGSVSGGVMIFGVSYWFGATGSTLLAALGGVTGAPPAAALGLVAVVVGLGYKAALVPFHFWAPDAYDGAPVSVAGFLSVVPKIGAILALAQVVRDLPVALGWPLVIAAISVLTMTYGNLAALVQRNVVRLLAYSSVAQSGYFLLGVAATGGPLARPSLVVFAAAYAAMNLGAFAVVLRIGRDLDAFTGLGRSRPATGAAMVIFLLSLVGIPPLAGFAGKFLLFGAALASHLLWLAIAAILNSVLSLAVYLRIVVPMYRTPDSAPAGRAPNPLASGVWGIALAVTVGLGAAVQLILGRVGP